MARIRSSLRYDESQTPPVQNCNLVLAILQRNHLRPVVTLLSSGFLWGLQYSLTVGLLFWSPKTRLAVLRVSLPCGLPNDPTTRKNYDEDTHCASIPANSLRCMVAAIRYVSTDRGQTPGCPCASLISLSAWSLYIRTNKTALKSALRSNLQRLHWFACPTGSALSNLQVVGFVETIGSAGAHTIATFDIALP